MRNFSLFLCAIASSVLVVCQGYAPLAVGPSVLITGANRGIGLALVAQLAKTPGVKHIFAGSRALKLKEFEKDLNVMIASIEEYKKDKVNFEKRHLERYTKNGDNEISEENRVQQSKETEIFVEKAEVENSFKVGDVIVELVKLDVGDDASIETAHAHVEKRLNDLATHLGYGDKARLDLLVNNAGVMYTAKGNENKEELGFDPIKPKRDVFIEHIQINTMGSVMTTAKFLPLLRISGQEANELSEEELMKLSKNQRKTYNKKRSLKKISGVIFISSTTSSMAKYMGRRSQNNEAYPLSKAALNHYMKSIADPKYTNNELISLSICPGWVATDMGNSVPETNKANLLSIEKSTTEMIERILTFDYRHNAKMPALRKQTVASRLTSRALPILKKSPSLPAIKSRTKSTPKSSPQKPSPTENSKPEAVLKKYVSTSVTSTPSHTQRQAKSIRTPRQTLTATSPRKTRALHKKEEHSGIDESDCKCEACGTYRPLDALRNCPNCVSIFHMSCLSLEPETIAYFNANPTKWQCPRCISCAECSEYIFDSGNVQCTYCGKVYHGSCRPKKATPPIYPYNRWTCDRCESSHSRSSMLTPSPNSSSSKENIMALVNAAPSSKKKSLSRLPTQGKSSRKNDGLKLEMEPSDMLETRQEINSFRLTSAQVSPSIKPKNMGTPKSSKRTIFRKERNGNKEDLALQCKLSHLSNQMMCISMQWLYFGPHIRFKPIYESSYPEPIQSSALVYICEFCLRPLNDLCQFKNHLTFCPWKHPPAMKSTVTQKLMCGKLREMLKRFTAEICTFTFYILTEITPRGCIIVGYFSKEKNPSKNNNLSCLLTLPSSQGKGYGKMLIDLSYHLSKREHKIGSPEHPLSDMGLMAYRSYWKSAIVSALRKRRNSHAVSIKDLSVETAIHNCDIISTLLAAGMLLFKNDSFYIDTNQAFNATLHSLRRRTIDSEDLLHWRPAFDVQQGNKMNSYAAD
uniref:Histone acetyltransferase n=1 Tax=Ditylenchus dipsaci TaxID=166011 RepID=A0A915CZZ1_9BILA